MGPDFAQRRSTLLCICNGLGAHRPFSLALRAQHVLQSVLCATQALGHRVAGTARIRYGFGRTNTTTGKRFANIQHALRSVGLRDDLEL